MKKKYWFNICLVFFAAAQTGSINAQTKTRLVIDLDKSVAKVSPNLYGLMTEEINHAYDGGIYAELIRNKAFKDNDKSPEHWHLFQRTDDSAALALDKDNSLNSTLNVSLRINANHDVVKVANDGYWGFPVKPGWEYHGSFYAKVKKGQSSSAIVSIRERQSGKILMSAQINGITENWQKFNFKLKADQSLIAGKDNVFVIEFNHKNIYWLSSLSLFPPTFNNRPNGNRIDIMEMLASMHPRFLRLPGGNYLEGYGFSNRFIWQNTLGPADLRPGHPGTWGYRSSDGLGLLEYLEWCEDLHMEPVLAVFAGYTLNGDHLEAGPLLQPFVEDALQEIEYVTGDTTTYWGKVRATDGHPAPFPLHYIEVGNEDGFDGSGSYDKRFAQFYDGIRKRYPNLKIISTVGGKDWLGQLVPLTLRTPDVYDEHYYRSAFEMESDANHYDHYDRSGPEIFVGEWATREGTPTPNFNAALGDAAWMTGMERNSDIVVMSCYAPLFVNVNPGEMQWSSDLIGYNASDVYASPSFYVEQMFNNNRGDEVLRVAGTGVPSQVQQLDKKDSINHVTPKTYPSLFYVATKDSKRGILYIKIVNAGNKEVPVDLVFSGKDKIKPTGNLIMLHANSPQETNSMSDPKRIIPTTQRLEGIKKEFIHTVPAYSVNILKISINH